LNKTANKITKCIITGLADVIANKLFYGNNRSCLYNLPCPYCRCQMLDGPKRQTDLLQNCHYKTNQPGRGQRLLSFLRQWSGPCLNWVPRRTGLLRSLSWRL